MKTAEAAVLPGSGRTARSSLPEQSLFAKGRWYYGSQRPADPAKGREKSKDFS